MKCKTCNTKMRYPSSMPKEEIEKVEKEHRDERNSGKDDLHPENGSLGRLAVDHDEFPDIPRG